jgi:hypothetical protein
MKKIILYFLLIIVIINGCNRIVNNKNKSRNLDSTQVSQKVLYVKNQKKLIYEEQKRIRDELITLIQDKWVSFKPDTIHDKFFYYTYQIQMDISDSKYLALYGEIVDAGSVNQVSSIILFRENRTDKLFQINIPTNELKKIIKEDSSSLEGFFLVNNIQISPLITTKIKSVSMSSEHSAAFPYYSEIDFIFTCDCIDYKIIG